MTLYDIDAQIAGLIDQETGEIMDFEAFEELQIERETKLENIACWIKNLNADAAALKAEADALNDRRKAIEKKSERLSDYLSRMLGGQKFSTAKCDVKFRKSKSVEVDPEFLQWCKDDLEAGMEFLRFKEPEVDKAAVKEALKAGQEFSYARLIENISMTIK